MPNKPIAYYHYTYHNTTDAKFYPTPIWNHTWLIYFLLTFSHLNFHLLQLDSSSKHFQQCISFQPYYNYKIKLSPYQNMEDIYSTWLNSLGKMRPTWPLLTQQHRFISL